MVDEKQQMNSTEALIWRCESDPFLLSTFTNITVLDQAIDFERFVDRMERATYIIPRLRQRVYEMPGTAAPIWVNDSDFDIRYHIRHVSLPSPGSMRQLLDLGASLLNDPFERSRPLWQFTVIEGLSGGRSALMYKLHHTIADGEGTVALVLQFLDFERDPHPLPPIDDETKARVEAMAPMPQLLPTDALQSSLATPLSFLKKAQNFLRNPADAATEISSALTNIQQLLSQAAESEKARSPLWKQRTLRKRLEVARVPHDKARLVAEHFGGTLNTVFVTAVAHAAATYHIERGAHVESLRTSMAVSTRTDLEESNAFSLVTVLAPTADMPIVERFKAIAELLDNAKNSDVSLLQKAAQYSSFLPTSVVARIARTQGQSIDFGTSNVKGADFPVFIAGAKLLQNHPFGPLAGAAFNVTLLSYDGFLDMGINIDSGAIEEPEALRDLIEGAFEEMFALVPTPVDLGISNEDSDRSETENSQDLQINTHGQDAARANDLPLKKRRWFRRSK
jgi:diacylglycerol O-acyltransferase / wax synthase